MLRGLFILLCLGLGTWSAAQTKAEPEKSIEQGPIENRVKTLASIQPGLGTVMHEMAYRLTNIYWAANGGNWGLAQYQLKELLEAQEVGAASNLKCNTLLRVRCSDAKQNFVPTTSA
ncbi:hypothetical protein [Cupriavidus sp. D39]|uniref:hypothetical protein n=1 Tax=Cupriavidus sp. D39 TaxID=2997877 RepID=UPI00226E5514|nr:hypothetical protein [Cupriavidus sp. D39]MCY0853562.1 hypothetical protein [Cupriavidus sp. D39]